VSGANPTSGNDLSELEIRRRRATGTETPSGGRGSSRNLPPASADPFDASLRGPGPGSGPGPGPADPKTGMGRSTGGSSNATGVSTDPRLARARLRGMQSSVPSSKGALSAGDLREPSSMFADARETMRVGTNAQLGATATGISGTLESGLPAVPESADAADAECSPAEQSGSARSGSARRRRRHRPVRTLSRSFRAAFEIASLVGAASTAPGSAELICGAQHMPSPAWPASAVRGASSQAEPRGRHVPPFGDEATHSLTPPAPMCLPGTPAPRILPGAPGSAAGPLLPGGAHRPLAGSILGLSPVGSGSGTGAGQGAPHAPGVWSPFDRSRFVASGTRDGAAHGHRASVAPPALPRHPPRSKLAMMRTPGSNCSGTGAAQSLLASADIAEFSASL